jgi:hypothetical protein
VECVTPRELATSFREVAAIPREIATAL